MKEVTSRGIHKPWDYRCASESRHRQPGQSLAHFSLWEPLLGRRKRGEGNELSISRENSVSAALSLLQKMYCMEKIAVFIKTGFFVFKSLICSEKTQVALNTDAS